MQHRIIAALATVTTAGLTAGMAATAAAEPFELRDGQWVRKPETCGTPMPSPAAFDAKVAGPVFAAGEPQVVYLNKNGGMYHGSTLTSAAANAALTNIIPFGVTATIPALDETFFDWTAIAACVRAHYAPFNVTIVETEPTSGMYVEAVIGGSSDDLYPTTMPPADLLGIASTPNLCIVTHDGIAFALAEPHKAIPRPNDELCATIAHEVGHVLGLEHETLGRDNMSYIPIFQSLSKSFVDMEADCGTTPGNEMACSCGGVQTNSGRRLYQFIGPADPTPPTMTILDPGDGAALEAGFTITAEASEVLKKADLLIDNMLIQSLSAEPYTFTAPATLEDGMYTVAVRGTDDEYQTGTAEIMVQIGDGGGGGGGICSAGGSPMSLGLGLAAAAFAARRRRRT